MNGGRHSVVDIMSDEVHQFEGPHAESKIFHRRVDIFHGGQPFLQDANGFTVERPRNPVHDEPGCVLHERGEFPPRSQRVHGVRTER